MKLYYSPGACSPGAAHPAPRDRPRIMTRPRWTSRARRSKTAAPTCTINPKGAVPALELDSGEVLTENAVILQYLGDRASVGEVLPPVGRFPPLPSARMGQFHHHRAAQELRALVQPGRRRRDQAASSAS